MVPPTLFFDWSEMEHIEHIEHIELYIHTLSSLGDGWQIPVGLGQGDTTSQVMNDDDD